MQETLFIIGREPELSVAELESVAPSWRAGVVGVTKDGVLLQHKNPLPAQALNQLGGSIKQVSVEEYLDPQISKLWPKLDVAWLEKNFPAGRVEFGISTYGFSRTEEGAIKKHGLKLKKEIHD